MSQEQSAPFHCCHTSPGTYDLIPASQGCRQALFVPLHIYTFSFSKTTKKKHAQSEKGRGGIKSSEESFNKESPVNKN